MDSKNIKKKLLKSCGDCTDYYQAEFVTPPTLDEFVQYILKECPNEWGDVCLNKWNNRFIEYRYGELFSATADYSENKDRHISLREMHGGWSNMDYIISFIEENGNQEGIEHKHSTVDNDLPIDQTEGYRNEIMKETLEKVVRQASDREFDVFLSEMRDAWYFDEKDTAFLREIFFDGFIAGSDFGLDMAMVSTNRIKGAEA